MAEQLLMLYAESKRVGEALTPFCRAFLQHSALLIR